jgi:putative transposase
MSVIEPDKLWWTASEIASAGLPDLPGTMSGVDAMAKRLDWRGQAGFARRRAGRGGGWEYSWELFPMRARRKLLQEATPAAPEKRAPDATARHEVHAYFDSLPEVTKEKARSRLRIIQMVLAMERTGLTKYLAVDSVAKVEGVSDRTIWNWFDMISMVPACDWLPYLAPRNRAAKRNDKKAECSPEFMERLKADYLRLERPSFTSSYRRCVRLAKDNGWTALPDRTARRRLNEQVPRVTQIFAREGYVGLERCFPPQTRDRTGMVAMEGVNADCHKFDVFVQWPDAEKPTRPQVVAFQDIYSGKILSWRIDHNPNKVAVMAAFGDMIEDYGIPQRCLFDNGREFANKWLTAGTKTRFRFKIREDDPLGVLPLLGIQVHWATPGHGQAKPIERAFRDFADDIAKDPRFAGAYVGNRPDAKPENYQSHAVPLDTFLRVVSDGIEEHNARLGRRSETALGRSFDETFAESYATAPIRKATEEQRRLWLMGQEVLTLQKSHGLLRLQGNEYWSDWMNEYSGQKVVVRFDPEDLHAGVHIYAMTGAFMGFAECKAKAGFFDLTSAKDHARQKSAVKRTERKLRDQLRPMKVAQIAVELDALERPAPVNLEAKVVQPDFGKRRASKPLVERPSYEDSTTPEEAARNVAFLAEHNARKIQADAEREQDTARDRYLRAVSLERRSDAGERVGESEMSWLIGYQKTPEYHGEKKVHEDFGDAMFLK